MSLVAAIKERWPIAAMLTRCNISVPQRGKFPAFHRHDSNPSCEIYDDHIVDRSTGERFDVIAIYAWHKGISNADAIRELAAELPGREARRPAQSPQSFSVPPLHYSTIEAGLVAEQRGLSQLGVELAGSTLGTLAFGKTCGHQCWILTYADCRLAEARRMDGEKFPPFGTLGERKSHTLRGSCKSWPLGMNPPKVTVPHGLPIMLVEGGPDYLAACDVLAHSEKEFLPVAMLGAGQSIHTEAMPFFRGRDVLILAHPDTSGLEAAKNWARQIRSAGGTPTAQQLQGGDLNDLVKLHGAEAVATHLQNATADY